MRLGRKNKRLGKTPHKMQDQLMKPLVAEQMESQKNTVQSEEGQHRQLYVQTSRAGLRTNLNQVHSHVAKWDAEVSTTSIAAKELRFDKTGIRYSDHLISLSQLDRTQLFNKIAAPGQYFEKLSVELQAAALSERAGQGDFGSSPMLVLRNGAFETITKGELLTLPNSDVIRAVMEALGSDSDGLTVTRIGDRPDLLDLDMVSSSKEVAVRPGDVVQSGLHIVHERFGKRATLVEAFLYRLVCTNGMTRRECSSDVQSRTRKLPVNFPNGRELQMDQIRRLTRQNWDGLQAQLDTLRMTSERTANIEQLLTRWLQRARVSVRLMLPRLLAAWRQEGEENTQYGAVNALTRVATHHLDLSERQRYLFATMAGLLSFSAVHVCDRCFSVLTRAAAHENDSGL